MSAPSPSSFFQQQCLVWQGADAALRPDDRFRPEYKLREYRQRGDPTEAAGEKDPRLASLTYRSQSGSTIEIRWFHLDRFGLPIRCEGWDWPGQSRRPTIGSSLHLLDWLVRCLGEFKEIKGLREGLQAELLAHAKACAH